MNEPDAEKTVGSKSNPTAPTVTKLQGDEDQRGSEHPLFGSRGMPSQQQPHQQQQHQRLVTTYPAVRSQQNIYSSDARSATTRRDTREHQSSSQVLVQNSTMHGEPQQSIEASGGGYSSHLQQQSSAVDVRLRKQPGLHQQPSGHIKTEPSELASVQVMHDVGTAVGHAAPQLFPQQQYPCPPLPSGQAAHRIVVRQHQPQGSMSRSTSAQSHPYVGSQRFYTKSLEAAMSAETPNANTLLFADASPKEKYRDLKRKLKMLVYENESYQEELRNLQRKLLKISRDKNFLLDRLSNYEGEGSPSSEDPDSDASEKTLEEKAPARGRKRGSKGQSSGGKRNKQQHLDSAGVALNGTQYAPAPPNDHRSAASVNDGAESQPNGDTEL